MPKPIDEEAQLLEVLKLIDAHRNGEIDADQLEEKIWRVRHGHPRIGPPWLWAVIAALLVAATALYAIS
jgi:hypothetical protein